MASERSLKIRSLFEQALDLEAGGRAAFLAHACPDDPEIHAEVAALLAADADAADFLEQPLIPAGFEWSDPVLRAPISRERIGPYRLLRRAGEGGMSEVYLAIRDDDEYRQEVALKIIRHEFNREELFQRFRAERQILAGLDHPNVAKLLDGGSTDDGLPYLVMDYIDGIPIDDYCDRHRLTLEQRLELFRTVCAAVQYAHRNLVVHRDIKPSNILVTAQGVPKLLDFGIAKLIKPHGFATDAEATRTGARALTPRYASPEQVRGAAVTTASDVYSLGVLLYRLLTARFPFDEPEFPEDLARIVIEQEAVAPSSAIDPVETGNLGSGAGSRSAERISRDRGTYPQQLRRRLRGDLDNIVLMALRKEPERRYASVEQLSEDLRRSLVGLPVIARKDTLRYRSTRFVQRNWIGVGVAAAFTVLLVAFSVTMALQASRIAHERDQARHERDRAERVQAFMQEIFASPDPLADQFEDLSARQLLDRGAARIDSELGDEPLVQAALMQTIGSTYRNLGLYEQAGTQLQRALDLRQRELGPDQLAVAESLHALGVLRGLQGDDGTAQTLLTRALELRRALAGPRDRSLVEVLNDRGIVMRHQGDYAAAERDYREALRIHEAVVGEDRGLATAKNNLAALLLQIGRHEEAEALFRESLELRRRLLGPEHAHLAQSLSNLGAGLGIQGRYEEAEPLLREALAMYRDLLDADHPSLVEGLNNLGKLLQHKGDLDDAEPLYREALEIERKRLGLSHPNLAHLQSNLADLARERGETVTAERIYREALAIRRAALPADHADIGISLIDVGRVLLDSGRGVEAEPVIRAGLAILDGALPPDHWRAVEARGLLGAALADQRRFESAEPWVRDGLARLSAALGAEHPRTQEARRRAIAFYRGWGKPDEAARIAAAFPARPDPSGRSFSR